MIHVAQVTDSSVVPLYVHDHFLRVVLKLSQNSDSLCNWLEGSGCQVFVKVFVIVSVFSPLSSLPLDIEWRFDQIRLYHAWPSGRPGHVNTL